eukprot:7576705-Pyramimonas_sp.AAC.1
MVHHREGNSGWTTGGQREYVRSRVLLVLDRVPASAPRNVLAELRVEDAGARRHIGAPPSSQR